MGHREGCSVPAFYVTMKNKNFQCLDCKWLIDLWCVRRNGSHCLFYSDAKDSSSLYESMKKELQMFIDTDFDDEEKRSDFYEVFVNRY